MGRYLKSSLCDMLLTFVVSACMSYLMLNGFYVDSSLQHGVLPALVALVCVVALFAVARNGKTARIGGVIYGFALVVAWIVAGAATPGGQIFIDNESNYMIFIMVATIAPTLCFLLTRNKVGAAILFIAGVVMLAVIQLLYERNEVLWTVLFIAGILALIIFKNYQQSLKTATTLRSASMLPGLCVALAAVIVSLGIGAGVWFGIIAPLNPDAAQIKLITEYRSLETKQVVGTSDIFQVPNLDMTSKETNDGSRTTDDIKESTDGTRWAATGEEDEPDDQDDQNSFLGIDIDSLQDTFDLQQNPSVRPLLLGILVAILLLIIAYFVGRRMWRKRRLAKFQAMGASKEFAALFLFLLGRIKRIGVVVPSGQTMNEFGVSADTALEAFNNTAGVKFSSLAVCYSELTYGKGNVNEQSVDDIEHFYSGFYKAAREQLGNVKYFFKSFRL